MPDPSQPDAPKPTGNSASPFDTDEIRPIRMAGLPEKTASIPGPTAETDGYELEGFSEPDVEEPPRPVPIPAPPVDRPKVKPRPKAKVEPLGSNESGSTEFVTEVSEVDPVWTRLGEWGPDLIRVGAAGLGTFFLAYLFGFGTLGFLVFLAGMAVTAFMSYPLLITLERPVRITPEQAVADFFGAASHHFPHYRRMFLLLSEVGRSSGKFATFEDFRDYWKGRVDRWRREAGAGKFAPLKFVVDGFRSDKSTGKETSRADYTVHVYLRDREDVGAIDTFQVSHGLVKGPDRMWYLNRGTLEPASK